MQRISTLEVAHYGKNSQIQFLLKTMCFKLGMVVQREKIRNKKNQQKKVWGGVRGEGDQNKTHSRARQPFGTEEGRGQAVMRP